MTIVAALLISIVLSILFAFVHKPRYALLFGLLAVISYAAMWIKAAVK